MVVELSGCVMSVSFCQYGYPQLLFVCNFLGMSELFVGSITFQVNTVVSSPMVIYSLLLSVS